MDDSKYLAALKEAVLKMDYDLVAQAAQEAMEAGVDPFRAIGQGMSPALAEIGEKFRTGEYFLSELIVAGDVMKEGLKIIHPYLKGQAEHPGPKVVIATVQGDNHEIGKNIVRTLLAVRGFEVIDLGADVPARRVVEAVQEHQPMIVGLSALLTVTMPKMGEIIKALKEVGFRDKVKVMIGGGSVTPQFAQSIGADHSSTNAAEGVEKCLSWVKP
jgi:corrinoid protein of di/trimethylamine methyltransferase